MFDLKWVVIPGRERTLMCYNYVSETWEEVPTELVVNHVPEQLELNFGEAYEEDINSSGISVDDRNAGC